MHDFAVRPHYGYLMAQPPRLEPLDQAIECNSGAAHFPLIVRKALRFVVGDRIVILAHVREHAQQSFALRGAAFAKTTVLGRHEQCGKQSAVLLDVMMSEIAVRHSPQLPQKVGRQTASREGLAQLLQFLKSDPLQKCWL